MTEPLDDDDDGETIAVYLTDRADSCPYCGGTINAHASALPGQRPPSEGDIGVCGQCAGILIYTGDRMRAATEHERRAILAHPGAAAVIARYRRPVQ